MAQYTEGFGRILVPLDGSSLAERAIPIATQLARATQSSVLLARVSPFMTWATAMAAEGAPVAPEVYQRLMDDEDHEARAYLAQQAGMVESQGVPVLTCFARGEPASCLIDIEGQEKVGLVIMTTHGRTGLARFALGSVADRLVRVGRVPVFLLRSFGKECSLEQMHSALVPLDGSARAEQILTLVQRLAGRVLREVVLLRVVGAEPTSEKMAVAKHYLEDVAARERPGFEERGCQLTTVVLAGDVAEQIVRRAEGDCQLVAMATRGRAGAARWALGSVADQVLQAAVMPLLLVRATG